MIYDKAALRRIRTIIRESLYDYSNINKKLKKRYISPSIIKEESTYKVKSGDNASSIAKKYNVSLDALKKKNKFKYNKSDIKKQNPLLKVGQVIIIPDREPRDNANDIVAATLVGEVGSSIVNIDERKKAMQNIYNFIKNRKDSDYSQKKGKYKNRPGSVLTLDDICLRGVDFSYWNKKRSDSAIKKEIKRWKDHESSRIQNTWKLASDIVNNNKTELVGSDIKTATYYYNPLKVSGKPDFVGGERACWRKLGSDSSGHVFGLGGPPWDSCPGKTKKKSVKIPKKIASASKVIKKYNLENKIKSQFNEGDLTIDLLEYEGEDWKPNKLGIINKDVLTKADKIAKDINKTLKNYVAVFDQIDFVIRFTPEIEKIKKSVARESEYKKIKYTIKSGDNLSKIGIKHKISATDQANWWLKDVKSLNSNMNLEKIKPGQKINIKVPKN